MALPCKVVITEKSDAVLATCNILTVSGTTIMSNVAVEIQQPLLKSAPKLLESLQTLVFAIHNGTQMDVMIATDEAEAVIAKALGGTK